MVVECGQNLESDGTTVFRSVIAEPYGAGGYAKLLLPRATVEVYHPDGEIVRLSLDVVIEGAPAIRNADSAPTTLPTILSTQQLIAIGHTPD